MSLARASGSGWDAHALRAFASLATASAGLLGLAGAVLAYALWDNRMFGLLVRALSMAGFSPDGVISHEGATLVRHAAAAAMILAWAAALLSGSVVRLVRLLLSRPPAEAAVRVASPGRAAERVRATRVWIPLVMGGLLVVAIVLRVPRLFTSLSYDEIFSIQHFAHLPWFAIPLRQIESSNHVVNSWFLHAALQVSRAEWWLRLLSLVSGAGSLWMFYRLGRWIAGSLAGLFAAWLAAVSPFHLWFSTLARGYMPGLFLALMGWWLLVRASTPPSRKTLIAFGLVQLLAAWSIPTLSLVPFLLAVWILLGLAPSARPVVGVDPASPSGRAWLAAALWASLLIAVLNLPTAAFIVLRVVRGGGAWGGAIRDAGEWLPLFQLGPWAVVLACAMIGVGLAAVVRQGWTASPWALRFLIVCWGVSAVGFAAFQPARAHLALFAGLILLLGIGCQALVDGLARLARRAERLVQFAASLAIVSGVSFSSAPALRAMARGLPMEDIRGAAQLIDSLLPPQGLIVTSGFGQDEVAYYAKRPVRLLAASDDPVALIRSEPTLCYLRLYADWRGIDPVFDAFQRMGDPVAVLEGQHPIPVWCFRDGVAVSTTSSRRYVRANPS